MSSLSWLDYSEEDKRRMLDVIDLFREKETRDELGIGAIRDAIADILFPGTSTIQRRAKYFLFVATMYADLERRRIPSAEIAQAARKEELTLINALASSEDPEGTIGILARSNLKRLPSNIYWRGLQQWGILLYPHSQDHYHRSLDHFYIRSSKAQRNDDGEPLDERIARNWHAGLPQRPGGFPRKAKFTLTSHEAKYLRERVLRSVPNTLLAELLGRGNLWTRTDFAWQHPDLSSFPNHIQEQLKHAHNFSEVMQGAALLYNLMLAELAQHRERTEEYQTKLDRWLLSLRGRVSVIEQWDLSQFWRLLDAVGARISPQTRGFVEAWIAVTLSSLQSGRTVLDKRGRPLIHAREKVLKRSLSRLENPRALELWNGAAGVGQLDYRWSVAQTTIFDILEGLTASTP